MQSWIKRLMLVGGVVAVVWTMVILYWRASAHMPSLSDVAIYLILLPFTLLALIVLIWRAGPGLVMSGGLSAVSGATANVSADQNGHPVQTAITSTLSIIASSAITRHGSTADALVAGLSSARTSFELDTQVTDANGYPVLSGRIADLDPTDLFSQYKRWTTMQSGLKEGWASEDERAIALTYQVCTELIQMLLAHPPLIEQMKDAEAVPQAHAMPLLCVIFVLPERWPVSQKNSVIHWLVEVITQRGWPAEKLLVYPLDELEAADPLTLLNRLNTAENPLGEADFYLLVASQSFIGADSAAAAPAKRQSDPKHRMNIPGEAAAGLVLTDSRKAGESSLASAVHVHQVARQQRDKVADNGGRIKPEILTGTIQDALRSAGANAGQLAAVTADTDARTNRIGELFEAMQAIAPEMEMTTACFKVESDCGAIGAVASLAALLAAGQIASEKKQPVVCVCNNDDSELVAVVITPQSDRQI